MVCENCGRGADVLVSVHRVYLSPVELVSDDVEHWCVSCCSTYPNEEVTSS